MRPDRGNPFQRNSSVVLNLSGCWFVVISAGAIFTTVCVEVLSSYYVLAFLFICIFLFPDKEEEINMDAARIIKWPLGVTLVT